MARRGVGDLFRAACFAALAAAGARDALAGAPLVAIDVGHSFARPGAVSARGKPEFEFNLAMAWPTISAPARRRPPARGCCSRSTTIR